MKRLVLIIAIVLAGSAARADLPVPTWCKIGLGKLQEQLRDYQTHAPRFSKNDPEVRHIMRRVEFGFPFPDRSDLDRLEGVLSKMCEASKSALNQSVLQMHKVNVFIEYCTNQTDCGGDAIEIHRLVAETDLKHKRAAHDFFCGAADYAFCVRDGSE